MRCFITGTDTGAGKTTFTCLLLRALRAAGHAPAPFKPVCCGSRADVSALMDAAALPELTADDVNPAYYKMPLAPLAAGLLENRPFSLPAVHAAWEKLSARYPGIIVEGAGGWEVPLTPDLTTAHLAAALGLPVIVVVNNKLGALNHTLLTVRSIRAHGLVCAGIVLNHVDPERDTASISNAAMLRTMLPDVPVLAEIMHGETEIDAGPFLSPPAAAAML